MSINFPKSQEIKSQLLLDIKSRGGSVNPKKEVNEHGETIYESLAAHFHIDETWRTDLAQSKLSIRKVTKWELAIQSVVKKLKKQGLIDGSDKRTWKLTIEVNNTDTIIQSQIREAIATSNFTKKALCFLKDERFQGSEVIYKLKLAENLREAQTALLNGDSEWLKALQKAINSHENNIVNWRQCKTFLDWCKCEPDAAIAALRDLWNDSEPLYKRISTFAKILGSAGLSQPGAQLCLTSVLLMAGDPVECPPMRVKVLTDTVKALGLPKSLTTVLVAERYRLFIEILDALVELSSGPQNRLEAQGIIWCATGGWGEVELKIGANLGPQDENIENDIALVQGELIDLKPTERETVIAARRGQGRYRDGLLGLWLNCSVTGCETVQLLRASHLKPWKLSTNIERLDRFNGLLLTPNLDLALDRHLISFNDDGSILISSKLSVTDTQALGLHQNLRLRFVKPEHVPYLSFHRATFNSLAAG